MMQVVEIPVEGRTLTYSILTYDRKKFISQGLMTGHAFWPCSRLLSDFISTNKFLFQNKTILELGCGLGFCGSVALLCGANRVIFTDGDSAVLEKAEIAFKQNSISNNDNYKFTELIWGESCPMVEEENIDIIIGSDLLYGLNESKTSDSRIINLFSYIAKYIARNKNVEFYLAMERRDLSIDLFFSISNDLNMICTLIEIEDIFANRNDEFTDFWQYGLFSFKSKSKNELKT